MTNIKSTDLANPIWRLNNLYTIYDKTFHAVPFVLNKDQADFVETSRQGPNFVLKRSRQNGLTSIMLMIMLDECLFTRGAQCGMVELTRQAASDVLSKVKLAYDKMPTKLKKECPLVSETWYELAWANGSTFYAGTSVKKAEAHDILSISEFDVTQERSPALAAVIERSIHSSMTPSGQCFVSGEAVSTGSILGLYDMAERNSNGIDRNGFFVFG